MKKYLLSGLLLTCVFFAQAQNKKDSLSTSLQRNNEIKLNILFTILGSLEFTYERILNKNNAIGISAFIRLFEPALSNFNSGVTPYFRHYFGARKASGFFLEGNAVVLAYDGGRSGKRGYYIDSFGYSYPVATFDETIFGLGIATGAKFLTRKGFTGEIYFGASQTFGNTLDDLIPRAGLTLGKRF